jgi:dTDP-4-amino-4,6-dideoxygalactose transaminase
VRWFLADFMIPQAAPHLRLARFHPVLAARIECVLQRGNYILGEEVESFESSFAGYLGIAHCVGVNSGTDAIALALRALGVGAGDEVITVSMTAAGTAIAILSAGAKPRFIDVSGATRCMELDRIEEAITARTSAILPVHLHGMPVDMPRLMTIARQHGFKVVEDCAQAHGATVAGRSVGTFGDAGAFSFYPTKNLGCVGDGGAVVTGGAAVASRLRALRNYGCNDSGCVNPGFNSRLDELQAAVLNALLPHLDDGNAERVALAQRYRELLRELPEVELPPEHPGYVYHQFAIAIDNRDAVRNFLKERTGIGTGIHFSPPLHQQPAFATFCSSPLPVAEALSARLLSLPIQPEVAGENVAKIVEALQQAIVSCRRS